MVTGPLIKAGLWLAYPLALVALGAVLLLSLGPLPGPPSDPAPPKTPSKRNKGIHAEFKAAAALFGAIGIVYTLAEGTISNWILIYLREDRQIGLPQASWALSAFWIALACGRLLAAAVLLRTKAEKIWPFPLLLMIIVLMLLPAVAGPADGILAFAAAGMACSAFFPITVGLFTQRFPDQAALAASLMIAAGMVGASFGSFIIGPLRALMPLERIYLLAILYPCLALVLAVAYLARQKRAGQRPGK
jgi:fucose permease